MDVLDSRSLRINRSLKRCAAHLYSFPRGDGAPKGRMRNAGDALRYSMNCVPFPLSNVGIGTYFYIQRTFPPAFLISLATFDSFPPGEAIRECAAKTNLQPSIYRFRSPHAPHLGNTFMQKHRILHLSIRHFMQSYNCVNGTIFYSNLC